MFQKSNVRLKIFLFSAHPPIDSELITKWLEMGHEVYKLSATLRWHNEYSTLDERVIEMIPQSMPDVIICGNLTDTLLALSLKFFRKCSTSTGQYATPLLIHNIFFRYFFSNSHTDIFLTK